MNSAEIAQMLSAQNSMFLGQRSYAQQIGLPTGGGGFQRNPSAPGAPPVWNAGPSSGFTGPGYGGGSNFAGGAMSAMGALGTAGTLGIGALSMASGAGGVLGVAGKAASLLDPISMGMGGFRMAGLAGGLAGAALPLAAMGGAAMMGGAFLQGGQHQAHLGHTLNQNFQQFNPNSRTGQGFSRDDAQAIGSTMRGMAHLPEMMTSMEELTKLLPKLKQSGSMQGVRDATEFAQRFKESVKTIRDVSKVLGTTMEEASSFFAHSRSVGFLGKQATIQNAMNVQFTSGTTGMTVGQVMQGQQAGADMARQMGAKGSLGAKAFTNISQSLARAQQTGAIGEGAIEDVTGMQGPEAIAAFAQRSMGVLANIGRSTAPGRLSIAGMMDVNEEGKASINEDLARRMREGTLGKDELKQRASRLTRKQKVAITAQWDNLAMDYAGKTGTAGITNLLKEAAGQRYGDDPNALNILLQRQGGLSYNEADIFSSNLGQGGGETEQRAMMQRRSQEAVIRQRTDPSAIMKRLKTRAGAAIFGGVEEAGSKVFTSIGKAYDEFIDDLVGRHVVTLSKEGAERFASAMGGGSGKKELFGDMEKAFASASAQKGGLKGPGALGRFGAGMMGGAVGLGAGIASGDMAMALGGAAGFVPGIGRAMGGMALGADMIFQNAANIRDSEVGAFFNRETGTTGRTDAGQRRRAESLGIFGKEGLLQKGAGNFAGREKATAALDEMMASVYDGLHGADSSDAKRMDLFKEKIDATISMGLDKTFGSGESRIDREGNEYAVNSKDHDAMRAAMRGDLSAIGGEAGLEKQLAKMEASGAGTAAGAIRAGMAMRKQGFQGDFAVAAAAAVDMNLTFSAMTGATATIDVGAAKKEISAAEDGLEKAGFNAETAQFIKDNPEGGRAVAAALSNGDIRNAIIRGSPAEALKLLSAQGINIKEKDLERLRGAVRSSAGVADKGAAAGAIGALSKARSMGDVAVLQKGFREASDRLSAAMGDSKSEVVKNLQAALQETGTATTVAGAQAGHQKVQDAMASLRSAIESSSGDVRDSLVKQSGDIGTVIESVRSSAENIMTKGGGKIQGVKGLVAGLGGTMSETLRKDLEAAGITDATTKLNKTQMARAKEIIGGARGSELIAGKGDSAEESSSTELMKLLTKLDKNADLQNTVLTSLVANRVSDESRANAGKIMDQQKETTPPAKAKGEP